VLWIPIPQKIAKASNKAISDSLKNDPLFCKGKNWGFLKILFYENLTFTALSILK